MNHRNASADSLAERIRRGDFLLGTVLSFADIALAELATEAFDFVWVDLEHGALGVRELQSIAIAGRASGCGVLARIPDLDASRLTAILDIGVDGIVVPMVEDAEQASMITRRLRFPPAGTRGFGPRRSASYGRRSDYLSTADTEIACVVQIETNAGLTEAKRIAAVEGVDALVIGSSDLSIALGAPFDMQSPPMIAAVRTVQEAAESAGLASGLATGAPPTVVAELLAGRSTLVVYASDVRIYSRAIDDTARSLAQAFGVTS